MDGDRIISEVAKRHGILLDRDDPVLIINTMLELSERDRQEREAALAKRDADMVANLSVVLDRAEKQAGGQLASTAAAEMPRAIRQLAARTFWQMSLLAAGGGLALLLIGVAAGWWLHAPASELACADQADGSRACWMYTRLPTQPAAKR